MSQNYKVYREFKEFQRRFRKIKKRRDLWKKPKLHKQYTFYNKLLGLDGRRKFSALRAKYRKYKKTALVFKSAELGLNLKKTGYFNELDKYKSSKKLEAIVTDALLEEGVKLHSLFSDYIQIYVEYKVLQLRKVVAIEIEPDDLHFLRHMPPNIYFNIMGTAYNKNGLDFEDDYFNSSNSFVDMWNNFTEGETLNINIYKA